MSYKIALILLSFSIIVAAENDPSDAEKEYQERQNNLSLYMVKHTPKKTFEDLANVIPDEIREGVEYGI